RRRLLLAGGGLLFVAAAPAFSQGAKLRRVAFVHPAREASMRPLLDAFRSSLRDAGYVEGRDVSIETAFAEDRTHSLPALAAAVVARRPDVIVTATSAAVAAFKKATSSIPIVFATVVNPVEQGFVSSLQRPGGNITGVLVHPSLIQKVAEVGQEALPAAKRFALLTHAPDPAHKFELDSYEAAARRLKFEPLVVSVARPEELDR